MCGIAGYFMLRREADPADVRAMCARILHRGPDDEGIYTEGGCGIGMRRLSIIDLAGGHQPIGNEDGSIQVVFNGEIYNYKELRGLLESRGHRFSTNSDTETIVHLYEDEGPQGIARLRGMFGIALWDSRRKRLLLARDRFGKKPLYYAVRPEGLYFASELKSLRGFSIPFSVDEEALRLYLQFGYVPDPLTIFNEVRKLLPGEWMTFAASGAMAKEQYWRVPVSASAPPSGITEDEAAAMIRDKFDESVRLRLQADVPLGAFLSGGIDSGSVVASMARQTSQPVKTFSIGFEEREFNELDGARMVAQAYGTDHHELVVRPEATGLATRLAAQFDEPFGDPSAIPTALVSEFARKHVTVVLTGDGGDEVFLGYESFSQVEQLRRLEAIPGLARRMMRGVAAALPYSARGKNWLHGAGSAEPLERYFEFSYPLHYFRKNLYEPRWFRPVSVPALRATLPWAMPESGDELAQAIHFEATAKLSGDMLTKVDRMSMMHSIEVRCPLMDHELAELAYRFPPAWHMRGGRGKALFLRAVGDRLPPGLLTLPKRGFGVPLGAWFRGPLRGMLHDHLTGASFRQRGIARPAFVSYLIDEHQKGRRDNAYRLWELLMLELWFREWSGELTAPAAARTA